MKKSKKVYPPQTVQKVSLRALFMVSKRAFRAS